MSDYYSMKNILHMTMDGSHGKSCGGDITPAKFLYSLCVHYCNIQCYTFLCACMCFFFGLGVNKINTSSSFIKLDYQLITKDTTPTKWKRSIGQDVWKRVQSFHALSGDATLLVTLLPPCVHQLEALSVLLLKFLFFYVSV